MSKKIKLEKLTKEEKTYRVLSIVNFGFTVICAGAGAFLLPKMIDNESRTIAMAMSLLFFVYMIMCIAGCVLAFRYYKATDQTAGVGHGAVLTVTTIINVVNLRFFTVMFLEGLNKSDAAQKLIGSVTETEYLQSLSGTWTALVIGMAFMMLLGVLSVIKLASRLGKK